MSRPFDQLTEADIPALLEALGNMAATIGIAVTRPVAPPAPPPEPEPPPAIANDYAAIAQAERRLRLAPTPERVPIACSRCVDG